MQQLDSALKFIVLGFTATRKERMLWIWNIVIAWHFTQIKRNWLNDLMTKADSKEDEYLKNLFIKIDKKMHLLTHCVFQFLLTIIHVKWSAVTTFMGYNISQNVAYPHLASKPKQVTVCKQILCQKYILHVAGGDLENSVKNLWERQR